MLAPSPAVSRPLTTPVVTTPARGPLAFLASLLQRAADAEAQRQDHDQAYWSSVARGL